MCEPVVERPGSTKPQALQCGLDNTGLNWVDERKLPQILEQGNAKVKSVCAVLNWKVAVIAGRERGRLVAGD